MSNAGSPQNYQPNPWMRQSRERPRRGSLVVYEEGGKARSDFIENLQFGLRAFFGSEGWFGGGIEQKGK